MELLVMNMNRLRQFRSTRTGGIPAGVPPWARAAARLHREERGAGIFMFLFFFTMFLGLTVIVVDFGAAFVDRRDQQKNADSMALAGVLELPTSSAAADLYARQWGARNGVKAGDTINITIDNSCWRSDPNDDPAVMDSISVGVQRKGMLLGIGELGLGSLNIGATAKACVGSLVYTAGLRPWVIPVITSPCFQLEAGGDPAVAGDYAPNYGQECIFRMDEPSNTGSIRLGWDEGDPCVVPGGGANAYGENIVEGSPAWCRVGDMLNVQPGLTNGPTKQAMQDLLATEGACDALGNQDGIDQIGEVFDPSGVIPGPNVTFTPKDCGITDEDGVDSPRFVAIVLTTQFPCGGGNSCDVPVVGFAGFFIDRCDRLDIGGNVIGAYPKCDMPGSSFQIVGRFIRYISMAGPAGALNPFGTIVRTLVE